MCFRFIIGVQYPSIVGLVAVASADLEGGERLLADESRPEALSGLVWLLFWLLPFPLLCVAL